MSDARRNDHATRYTKRFGYVQFDIANDAVKTRAAKQGLLINGRTLQVYFSTR